MLLAVIMVISCIMIVRELTQANKEISEFEKLAAIANGSAASVTEAEPMTEAAAETAAETEPVPVFKRNLQPLYDKNPDCIGWICIPDTTVDYPVMYTPDEPHKYLRKNFEGEYTVSGTPFLQESCNLESDNLVIYGHNMKNGAMFSDITSYVNASYRQENPTVEFETAAGLKIYTVFAAVQLKNNDKWYGFTDAASEEYYNTAVSDIKSRALYETGITPVFGDQLLTLSTCYGASSDDRLIVVCVLN